MAQESSGSTQLVTKFQLYHFLTVKNKLFQFYQDIVWFEKDVHKVDLGTGYRKRQSGTELISYFLKAIVMENITKPLNKGHWKYYSLLFAKTINKKEVHVIKM